VITLFHHVGVELLGNCWGLVTTIFNQCVRYIQNV